MLKQISRNIFFQSSYSIRSFFFKTKNKSCNWCQNWCVYCDFISWRMLMIISSGNDTHNTYIYRVVCFEHLVWGSRRDKFFISHLGTVHTPFFHCKNFIQVIITLTDCLWHFRYVKYQIYIMHWSSLNENYNIIHIWHATGVLV